ncbi:TraG family conjugative transposon ATPase [Filimonas effusa]|uniref:TraG family conjugative transposon ATPase n=1 Tax=Filimonas effusa TaxID=2508721 RepID=A0A4Q1DBZ0_9BACT|nr:TraG family conjugative transposon ATPase [Filimonas effusa]RXK86991.1 TraG family conjugative transposon ATPase [Filimonas effusa]
MEKWLTDILPIADIEHDAILSKQGDISFVYKVDLPEIFTLSADEYESIHQGIIRALKALPAGSVFHKQDYFTRKQYKGEKWEGQQSFLNKAAEQYFMNRRYLDHECYIILTRQAIGRRQASSMFSNLIRPTLVPQQTISADFLMNWENSASQFVRLMKEAGLSLTRLKNSSLSSTEKSAGLLENYCFLSPSPDNLLIKDIIFDKQHINIGSQLCQLFTVADADSLPGLVGPCVTYDKYSTDRTNFPLSFAAPCGLLLQCNHIYNQVIFIKDGFETRKTLEKRALRLRSLAAYSRENAISHEAVNAYLNEAVSEGRIPAGIHCNIMTIADNAEEAREQTNMVTAALAGMDAVAKMETVGAPQLFWACMPGNIGDLPQNEVFGSFLEQASCFLNMETNYRSLPPTQGIRFCDRLTGKPVFADFLDQPRQAGISTNMGMLVCGSSGGGKSMTVNHILRTLYDQGAHILVVDIGGSYRGLCELVKGAYLSYEEDKPIQFNPFYIAPGDILDTEKKESLKALLVALWKQENESYNRSEYVALSNALTGYFQLLKSDPSIFPCFDSFYEYLGSTYVEVLKEHRVKADDFDVNNFLYVLQPYYKENEFGYLLNARKNLDLLNQPFVVVEMDNLKDHPILFPVTALLIVELFISKMRKLKGTRKVLAIDEAWKAITKSGMAEFLKYAFKTIRKFNGVPIVITQELDDLISSPIIKDAIINNADIKILMDMRKFVNKFDKLQEALGLSEKGKTILLSVNKDNREIYTEVGGQIMKVYKNELSPHEYFAYTTEGREKVKVLEYAEKYGGMQAGIEALVRDMQQKAA